MKTKLILTSPEKIYLQISENGDGSTPFPGNPSNVNWAEEPMVGETVEYVRQDLVEDLFKSTSLSLAEHISDLKEELERYREASAVLYQVLGQYDAPEDVLDLADMMQCGEEFPQKLTDLLPIKIHKSTKKPTLSKRELKECWNGSIIKKTNKKKKVKHCCGDTLNGVSACVDCPNK